MDGLFKSSHLSAMNGANPAPNSGSTGGTVPVISATYFQGL